MKKLLPSSYACAFAMAMIFISCNHYESPPTAAVISSNSAVVLIEVSVKITVGGTVYDNLDANVRITGYNSANVLQWSRSYDLKGPLDRLSVQNGFHHYSVELLNKWGVNDLQSDIPGSEIWEGRADGPKPTTYVLGGSRVAKKLVRLVNSMEVIIAGIGKTYQPETRANYLYDTDGRLTSIVHETYNEETTLFEKGLVETFTYNGNVVSKIVQTQNGKPYAEYQYEYGQPNKITATNSETGMVTTQLTRKNYETNPNDSSISIDYSFSDGQSILYDFGLSFKNIVKDRTRQSGQLCNLGNYTYDKNINPFHQLGYMDFDLRNWSASNKLTEHIDYYACGYPTIAPLFYNYTYDQDGYPVKKLTTYKSSANQNSALHTEEDYYYQ